MEALLAGCRRLVEEHGTGLGLRLPKLEEWLAILPIGRRLL